MKYSVEQAIEILGNTPTVLKELLNNVSDEWLYNNEGRDTFSPFDVVGHLILGERSDWINRARTIIEHGESKTFEPFDRFSMLKENSKRSIDELLIEFETLRRDNLRILREMSIDPNSLELKGRHPQFGPVSLENHLATWVVHDLNHIAQISRVMAKNYKENAGPWQAYLPVLS